MAIAEKNYPALDPKTLNPPMNVTLVTDGVGLEKLKKGIQRIAENGATPGHDTETNMCHDFWFRRARCLQIGDKYEQFVIDLLAFAETEEKLISSQGHFGKNNGTIYKPVTDILDPVLCSNKFLKVGQNLAFEYEVWYWNFGRRIWNMYSIDLVERVIKAGDIPLKKYSEFSLQALLERYFAMTIDKSLQQSFDLKTPLTPEQVTYAALDIRTPLSVRLKQMLTLDKDALQSTARIENDAIGTYVEMHVVGQNMDDKKWMERVEKVRQRRIDEVKKLDETFIPICGVKDQSIDFNEIDRLEKIWKENFEEASPAEKTKAAELRTEKDKEKKVLLRAELDALKEIRKAEKKKAREAFMVLSKDRTKKLKVIPKCEGQAFLNYGSNPQLLEALKQVPGLKTLESVADDALLKYNDREMIQILRRYRKGKKETGTYGESWVQRWVTKAGAKEGWRHPGDGRLHCHFNQLEAETGRSSSSQPNAQNLPHEDEVRACFICDPPDENVRISDCCEADTIRKDCEDCHPDHECCSYFCTKCKLDCDTHSEEYCIVTCDMSGAELRIIAELANATSWINAFAKDQDVHSVSTEILYPEKWPALACKGGEKHFDKEKNKEVELPPCAYYKRAEQRIVLPNGAVIEQGDYLRKKCKCPAHNELRNGTKATNFLLCYGGGPDALADALGVSLDAAKKLMELHESKFPDVWGYLRRSGELAKQYNEARDMYGRRRLLPEPTYEGARQWYIDNEEERLELDEEVCEENLFRFKAQNMREPNEAELWTLTHSYPDDKQIRQAMRAMHGSIARRGKNHCIQGTNASIIKRAMGCGFDKNGKPYLWHVLPQYKARFQNMVHDELVIHCPKRFGAIVMNLVGDAFKRAAAEVMKKVIMEFEGKVADRWMK